jgi:RNA polymerase sigma factor (sigma-70 family)
VLVAQATHGDDSAWSLLVDRFSGLVWATARAHRLARDDAADVAQTTWLRLVENLDRIREPDRVGAWLATTARHESLRLLRRGVREQPVDDPDLFEAPDDEALDRILGDPAHDGALWRAFAALSERCKSLLRLLISDEEPSYEEVGAALGMPVGAIGPTRMRCLERLRRTADLAGLEG